MIDVGDQALRVRKRGLPLAGLAAAALLAGGAGVVLRSRQRRQSVPLLAQAAHARWLSRPDDSRALRESHLLLARLVQWFDGLPLDTRAAACREVGLNVELDRLEETGLCRFTIAQSVPVHRLHRCHQRVGIGVPVIVWRSNDDSERWDTLRPPEGISVSATAVLERRGEKEWTLRFLSPYRHDSVTAEGRAYPLAANFSAPFARLSRQAEGFRRTGFRGMLNSSAIARHEKLYLMQRYDPNRIPLLMVHGLQSTPVSFLNLVNDLSADPAIYSRYQIWHYHYRTGTPVIYNAAVLRRILRETLQMLDPAGNDFATNHLVALGHSMGGIMTHSLLCDSGYKLWDSVITVRPEKFACDANTGNVMSDIYLFEREKRIKRAILISVPHRGSPIADNWIGNLGQSLYRADPQVQEAFRSLLEHHVDQINPYIASLIKDGRLSSIRTLSANSPALVALAEIPPAVPFHTIIGQLRPGPVETGSDGVVAYASSHLDGAESEAIVPFGHESFLHPDAVTEIKRILHAHLDTLSCQ